MSPSPQFNPVVSFVRRVPFLDAAARYAISRLSRFVFITPRRPRPSSKVREKSDLVERTEEFNQASERYYAEFETPEFILNKPFSEEENFARRLFDMGVLFDRLRIGPGERIVDFGAGTCWLSHFLNRFGCHTYSVDVSETALALGRQLFERESSTRWELEPSFLAYDGHRIDLPDAFCDKIVVNDAFHHIPNQHEILCEMSRILRPGGMVGMREPGTGHASTEASRKEMETGVLENELVVEDLAVLAGECGFTRATVAPVGIRVGPDVDARELGSFFRRRGLRAYWNSLCKEMHSGHFLFLYKGPYVATTRNPQGLKATIRVQGQTKELELKVGETSRVRLEVTNLGDTYWLAGPAEEDPGWTRLGGHLWRTDDGRVEEDFNWLRHQLPQNIEAGETVEFEVALPPVSEPGNYEVVLDLVIERICWFAERGSRTSVIALRVS